MSSIGFDGGPSGPSSAGGGSAPISSAQLLALVYESNSDPTGLQLGGASQQLFKDLEEAITGRGETLTREEKEAFKRGDAAAVKAALKRLQEKAQAEARAQRDNLTHSGFRTPEPANLERLPSAEALTPAELLHIIYSAPPDQAHKALDLLDKWSAAQISELLHHVQSGGITTPGEKLPNERPSLADLKALLKQIIARRETNDRAFAPEKLQTRAAAYQLLRPRELVSDPKVLTQARLILMRHVSEGSFPARGRSGAADGLPVLQFLPGDLRATAQALGVFTLADFLARTTTSNARLLLARLLGLTPAAMLLAAQRAELLDLPITRGKRPYLKEVLLLSRLGAHNTHAFAKLFALCERYPARLEILADLITALQKGAPDYVGRERITKHELRAWFHAADKRETGVQVASAAVGGQTEVEFASERVLHWFTQQRWNDPEAAWDEMIARLFLLLTREGIGVSSDVWNRLSIETSAARVEGYRRVAEHEATDEELEEWREEQRLYELYLCDSSDASILSNLAPTQAPDEQRKDRMICFWMDPVADARHVVRPAGPDSAESVKAVYVCLDPDSGAVVPFGG